MACTCGRMSASAPVLHRLGESPANRREYPSLSIRADQGVRDPPNRSCCTDDSGDRAQKEASSGYRAQHRLTSGYRARFIFGVSRTEFRGIAHKRLLPRRWPLLSGYRAHIIRGIAHMGAISEQVDLFLDSLVNAPVKDDQALMQFPFFSLQKQPRMEPMIYQRDGVGVKITPGPKGIATIWDKDVLMYLASLINDRIERNLPVDRTVSFHAYDLLRATRRVGKSAAKKDYEALKDALFRLRSTTIETTIKSADSREERGFGWIDNWRIIRRDPRPGEEEGAMTAVEVTLNDWMFRAIVQDRRVLTINPNYFSLTKGLERRLYELARKHVGRQRRWDISLEKLIEKCGSTRELRFFKRDLKTIIELDSLPDYGISMSFDPAERKEIEAIGLDARRWSSNERIIVSFHPRTKLGHGYIDHDQPSDQSVDQM